MSNIKSNLTLVVDGNWLLMSRLSILRMRIKDEETLVKEMKLMMIKSINKLIREIPQIDNVIFVADGGSWRNKIEVPDFLKKDHVTYKGNREKDKDLDWDKIFKGYDEFVNVLKETGVSVYREQYVEGDDWVAYWSKLLNSKNINCLIWSADRDLTQLVKIDPKTKVFTACWNKNYITIESIEHTNDNDMDFFFTSPSVTSNQTLLETICFKAKKINEIHPMDVVIDKVIRGDLGDNILPVVYKKSNNSDKLFRVAQKELDLSLDITRLDEVNTYFEELFNKKAWKNKSTCSIDEATEHFFYNERLVWLDPSQYPDEILQKMTRYQLKPCNKDLSLAEQKIQAEKNEVFDALEEI